MAHKPGTGADGQPRAVVPPTGDQTLFEAIEQSGRPDSETYILRRWSNTFAILNIFPYTTGHIMVLPTKACPSVDELNDEVYHELWDLVRVATRAVKAAFKPVGLNVGINEGEAGGGSVPDHLHVHIVPRWNTDTNFMTSVANARILPMTLDDTRSRLLDHWPVD